MAGLVVTPGAYNSNSFVTVGEATTIASQLGIDITSWSSPSLTVPRKEAYLVFAADLLGDIFTFKGYRAYTYQRLCFPRANCQELFNIPLTTIPEDVKKAQVYLAVDVVPRYFESRSQEDSGDTMSIETIASFTMRDVQVSFKEKEWYFSDIIELSVSGKHTLLQSLLHRFVAQIKILDGSRKILLPYVEGLTTTSTTTTTTTTTTTSTTTT